MIEIVLRIPTQVKRQISRLLSLGDTSDQFPVTPSLPVGDPRYKHPPMNLRMESEKTVDIKPDVTKQVSMLSIFSLRHCHNGKAS
jgi:hypothetical protein